MIDQRKSSNLLDEARSVLGSAEEAIELLQARLGSKQTAPVGDANHASAKATANDPPAAMHSAPKQSSPYEVIMKRLSALNMRALESALDEVANVMMFYVTSTCAYNRHLETLRADAETLDLGFDIDTTYCSTDGTPGVRIGDVVRLRANPWQVLAELTNTVLSRHDPADPQSETALSDSGIESMRVTPPPQAPPTRLPATSDHGVVQPPGRLRAPQSLIEGRDTTSSGRPSPTLDQTAMVRMMDFQAREITQLRAQLNRQAEILNQLAQLIDTTPEPDG